MSPAAGPDAGAPGEAGPGEPGLGERIKALALALGFDLAGIAPARPTPETEFLREWIARGYAGCMDYLVRRADERVDPRKVLEGARSIVAVGLVYDEPGRAGQDGVLRGPVTPASAEIARYAGAAGQDGVLRGPAAAASAEIARYAGADRQDGVLRGPVTPASAEVARYAGAAGQDGVLRGPAAAASAEVARYAGAAGQDGVLRGPAAAASAEIARYAGGDDYHEVMRERLRALETGMAALAPGAVATRSYVDTGPVQERVFAALGGLGWIGKNTCLIHPRLGSYLFLGVVLCDFELAPDAREPDHCGSCTACLDACPTDAFVSAYELDATRCISYTTIEDPGPIPEPLRAAHGDRVFGCDVCQEVCPWNQRSRRAIPADPLGLRARLATREQWVRPTLDWLLSLDEAGFREATPRMALRRSRWRGLLRNALVAAGNARDPSLRGALERYAAGADAMLAEHARWALGRLDAPER